MAVPGGRDAWPCPEVAVYGRAPEVAVYGRARRSGIACAGRPDTTSLRGLNRFARARASSLLTVPYLGGR
jgi:hypothetical protein